MSETCNYAFVAEGNAKLGIPRQVLDRCELPVGHEGRHQSGNATWASPALDRASGERDSMSTQGPALKFCPLHGPIGETGYCRPCASMPSADRSAALDRASIPAMFNVLADEIRKLSEKLDAFENSRGYTEDALFKRVSVLSAQGSVNCEKIDSIEAQLTALRAEADKGRERITDSLDLVGAEEFTQIKCLLDLTNKRLKALELRDARGKKKQERKRRGAK